MFSIIFLLLASSVIFFGTAVPLSHGAIIMWHANSESDLAGYKLYLGIASGQYGSVIDVGNHTAMDLSSLVLYENFLYYAAVTACDMWGNESPLSCEVSFALDDLTDDEDNCPDMYNPDQDDAYPPQGNGIGDACDCEADFMCDGDVDGSDTALFKLHFGRKYPGNPCSAMDPCHGDFACDGDVDGTDSALFKKDFGRRSPGKPCPTCEVKPWCQY